MGQQGSERNVEKNVFTCKSSCESSINYRKSTLHRLPTVISHAHVM